MGVSTDLGRAISGVLYYVRVCIHLSLDEEIMFPEINIRDFSDNYRITEFAMAYFAEQYVNGHWESLSKPCRTYQEALRVVREAEGQ